MRLSDVKPHTLIKLVKVVPSTYYPKDEYVLGRPAIGIEKKVTENYGTVVRHLYKDGTSRDFFLGSETEVIPLEPAAVQKVRKIVGLTPYYHRPRFGATGSDPEVFVLDQRGEVIPSWLFLPPKGKDSLVHTDGFQGEFTPSPRTCHEEHASMVRNGLNRILIEARKVNRYARLTHKCVVDIPQEMLDKCDDTQLALGCSRSYNIYGESPVNVRDPRMLRFRFAGCHFHWGPGKMTDEQATPLVRMMDRLAGVASVSLLEGLEDVRRRHFYGVAGEYRLPPHGLEWRVLSSATLVHPQTFYLLFDLARFAANLVEEGLEDEWKTSDEETREVINSLDVEGARKILKKNSALLRGYLGVIYGSQTALMAERWITTGFKNHKPSEDMHANWGLNTSGSYDGFGYPRQVRLG